MFLFECNDIVWTILLFSIIGRYISMTYYQLEPGWVGGVAFRDRFSRLFDLSTLKEVTASEMCSLGWGLDGAWLWRRSMRSNCEISRLHIPLIPTFIYLCST